MIRVVCCICRELVMLKPGKCNGDSHSFCQSCLDDYCQESGLEPIEILIPKGAIINEEKFQIKVSNHNC